MTLDSSLTLTIADEDARYGDKRLPKGINVTEADNHPSAPGIEELSKPWGYLLIHNRKADRFKAEMDTYNQDNPLSAHECFIHYTVKRKQKKDSQGIIEKVVDEKVPTVSGLVFLQGETNELKMFLQDRYPLYHLVNDCSTGRPAVIPDKMMRPFMEVINTHPENITFLREPFEKFAKDHVKLRILTGLFAGLEGYVVRVDRDRQLVMDFGGHTVAIRGVHKEQFAIAEEPAVKKK